jgi:hypothetical protein
MLFAGFEGIAFNFKGFAFFMADIFQPAFFSAFLADNAAIAAFTVEAFLIPSRVESGNRENCNGGQYYFLHNFNILLFKDIKTIL